MKTVLLTLLVSGLTISGLAIMDANNVSIFSTLIINTCSPACPQEATCIDNECVFPGDPGEEPGGDPDCTENPEWTDAQGKITICHKTENSKNPWNIITVSSSSLLAHIAHGDTCGPCGEPGDNTPSCAKGEELCKKKCVPVGSCQTTK